MDGTKAGANDSVRTQRLRRCLRMMDLDTSDENVAQLSVMIEAMVIYQEREAVRGGAWKEFGPQDSAMHVRSKGVRMVAAAENPAIGADKAVDDGLDAMNYGAFFVRNVRGT